MSQRIGGKIKGRDKDKERKFFYIIGERERVEIKIKRGSFLFHIGVDQGGYFSEKFLAGFESFSVCNISQFLCENELGGEFHG